MRPAVIAVAIATVTLCLAACSTEEAGWTYAPPPTEVAASGAPSGEPGSPAPSGAPSAVPSAPASAAPSGPAAGTVVQVSAANIAFDQATLDIPADEPFTIEFANNDNGVPHNIQIRDASGAEVYLTDTFNGVETRTFEAPPLPAGAYQFVCTVHPNMIIDVTAQ
jgi:plastocyanin